MANNLKIGECYKGSALAPATFITYAPWQGSKSPDQVATTIIPVFTIWEIHEVLGRVVLRNPRGKFYLVDLLFGLWSLGMWRI
jgi:hypothetical protein